MGRIMVLPPRLTRTRCREVSLELDQITLYNVQM
jgi:hypothetical protein